MNEKLNSLYRRFPFLDSVISLIFGAVLSYLFPNVIDAWRQSRPIEERIVISLLFVTAVVVMSVYYKFFYSTSKKATILEKEREKNEIQRLKSEREIIASLYREGTKAIEKEDLSIIEKTEIFKQINLVTNDNKRDA